MYPTSDRLFTAFSQAKLMTRNRLTFGFFLCSLLCCIPAYRVRADEVIRDRGLIIDYSSEQLDGDPIALYRFADGISGELYLVDGIGDWASFNFIDTAGDERCLGRVDILWGGVQTITEWAFDGTVEGYTCPQVGQVLIYAVDEEVEP